jgi:cytidyltransferase-like protein
VYVDGCFDLMHYGHANALRQARAVGDQLVVGLIPDSEILRCKGPPILDERERRALVESVKWVDEVITGEQARWSRASSGWTRSSQVSRRAGRERQVGGRGHRG